MAMKFKYKQDWSIGRVVSKLVVVILSLYVGGVLVKSVGEVMVNTTSPFYKGLSLLGWTVGNPSTNGTAGYFVQGSKCAGGSLVTSADPNCLNFTTGTGVLAVVGIVGIASLVTEFVEFRMK